MGFTIRVILCAKLDEYIFSFLFQQCSTLLKRNFSVLVTFDLSSVNAFNLVFQKSCRSDEKNKGPFWKVLIMRASKFTYKTKYIFTFIPFQMWSSKTTNIFQFNKYNYNVTSIVEEDSTKNTLNSSLKLPTQHN